MALSTDTIREEILVIMDRSAAAMKQVVEAYAANRSWERDVHWLALQAAKEYAAAHLHARRLLGPTEPLSGVEEVTKALHDASEEVEHYAAYMEVLNWLLDGRPCPVPEWQRYGNPGSYEWRFGGSFEETRSSWPWSYAYYTTRARLCGESSDWGRKAILACGEGGAVGWHYMMSRLEPADEFLRRISPIERDIVADELYHGPETIGRLAKAPPPEEEFEQVKDRIKKVRALELRQRNEQFQQPLSEAEIDRIESDFLRDRTEPIELFRTVHLKALTKDQARQEI
jgi:hypothetical protein